MPFAVLSVGLPQRVVQCRAGLGGGWQQTCEMLPPNVKNGLTAGPGFASKLECVPQSFECCGQVGPELQLSLQPASR